LPTVAGTAQALKGRPVGRILVLVGVVVAAFLVSRSCQRNYVRITSDQAVAIGQRKIDFRPEGHTVRLVQRGIPPKRYWAISYWIRDPKAPSHYRKVTVVLVDANRGTVAEVIVDQP
jgi:ribosomal protein L34E